MTGLSTIQEAIIIIMYLCVQVSGLQATLRNLEGGSRDSGSIDLSKPERRLIFASGTGPTQSAFKETRTKIHSVYTVIRMLECSQL